jgi:hypothetical protein
MAAEQTFGQPLDVAIVTIVQFCIHPRLDR